MLRGGPTGRGEAGRGRYSWATTANQACGLPHATQAVVSSPAPQVPHYWRQEEPLGKLGLPLPSLEGSSGSDPSCQRPPLQPGPCTCLLPGAWETLSQVRDTVGDLGAGSAHSGSWRPLPTLRDRVGSRCASHVTTPLWASVFSLRKWGVREPG